MEYRLFIVLLMMVPCLEGRAQMDDFEAYIYRYKALAVSEMERTGIPASIKLAQALLESDAGRSDLARKGNNHFGIKCGGDWNGRTYEKIDDETDNLGRPRNSCFRSYRSVEESYIAHSEFLTNPRKSARYAFLFELPVTDYKGWARGLRKAGYATSSSYDNRLIEIIERFKLNELDRMTPGDLVANQSRQDRRRNDERDEDINEDRNQNRPKPHAPELPGSRPSTPASGSARPAAATVAYINDVKYATALSRETVAALAKRYEVSTRVLLRYNENLESERQLLGAGDRIFLQPKRSSFRGRQQWHRIDRGETLMSLSVTYGVSLESLRERNRLTEGVEPVPGSRIKLRGRRVSDSPPVFKVDKIIRPQLEEPADSTPVLEGNKLEEIEGGQVKPAPTDSRPQNSPAPAPVLTQPSTEQNAGGPRPQSPNPANEDPFGEPVPAPAADVYHTVQPGETLWRISQQYGTTVDKIKQLNSLGNDSIRIGMRLKVK